MSDISSPTREAHSVFASVGSMLPFDRFVQAVDEWAGENRDVRVLLQIGDGTYLPRHAESVRILPPAEYLAQLHDCSLFVAHAGIGSIMQALEIGKRILMLPRLAGLGEHTTDHQLHTVSRFRDTPGLEIAGDVDVLKKRIGGLLAEPPSAEARLSSRAPPALIAKIREFLYASS